MSTHGFLKTFMAVGTKYKQLEAQNKLQDAAERKQILADMRAAAATENEAAMKTLQYQLDSDKYNLDVDKFNETVRANKAKETNAANSKIAEEDKLILNYMYDSFKTGGIIQDPKVRARIEEMGYRWDMPSEFPFIPLNDGTGRFMYKNALVNPTEIPMEKGFTEDGVPYSRPKATYPAPTGTSKDTPQQDIPVVSVEESKEIYAPGQIVTSATPVRKYAPSTLTNTVWVENDGTTKILSDSTPASPLVQNGKVFNGKWYRKSKAKIGDSDKETYEWKYVYAAPTPPAQAAPSKNSSDWDVGEVGRKNKGNGTTPTAAVSPDEFPQTFEITDKTLKDKVKIKALIQKQAPKEGLYIKSMTITTSKGNSGVTRSARVLWANEADRPTPKKPAKTAGQNKADENRIPLNTALLSAVAAKNTDRTAKEFVDMQSQQALESATFNAMFPALTKREYKEHNILNADIVAAKTFVSYQLMRNPEMKKKAEAAYNRASKRANEAHKKLVVAPKKRKTLVGKIKRGVQNFGDEDTKNVKPPKTPVKNAGKKVDTESGTNFPRVYNLNQD